MMEYVSVGIGMLRLLLELQPTPPSPEMVIEQWVDGTGTYLIHQEISEADACRKAESRAKLNAVKAFSGEYISADSFLSCRETNDSVDCPMHTFTWSMLDGLISGVRNRLVRATENLDGQRVCRVTLEARISTRAEPPDPNFDLQVKVAAATLRDGDPLVIEVEPSQAMYLNIFVEAPDHKLGKVFPNRFDPEMKINVGKSIPTNSTYDLLAEYPANMTGDTHEVVHVLATRNPLLMLDSYSVEDFNLKILELSTRDTRYVTTQYRLVK